MEWLLRTLLLIYVGCVPAFLRVDGQTRSQVALICYFSNDESDIVTPIFLSVVIVATAILQWYTEMQAEMLMDALTSLAPQDPVKVVRRLREERQDEKLDRDPERSR